jgi:hypothetical protein
MGLFRNRRKSEPQLTVQGRALAIGDQLLVAGQHFVVSNLRAGTASLMPEAPSENTHWRLSMLEGGASYMLTHRQWGPVGRPAERHKLVRSGELCVTKAFQSRAAG